jgi:hypothetical protein
MQALTERPDDVDDRRTFAVMLQFGAAEAVVENFGNSRIGDRHWTETV